MDMNGVVSKQRAGASQDANIIKAPTSGVGEEEREEGGGGGGVGGEGGGAEVPPCPP